MVSILITDAKLVCAEWSNTEKKKHIATNLCAISFNHHLSTVLDDEAELNAVIGTAFSQLIEIIPLNGRDVTIGVHQELLLEEIVTVNDELHIDDLYDYFIWRQNQKWGKTFHKDYSLFAQNYPENPNQYFVNECPTHLIEIIKLTVSELSAQPIWMGPEHILFLETSNHRSVYIFEENNLYRFLHRGQNGIASGKLRFLAGGFKLLEESKTMTIADIFNTENNIIIVDNLSENKLSRWAPYDHNIMDHSNEVVIEGVFIPEETTSRELNSLTRLIIHDDHESNMNYFRQNNITMWKPQEVQVKKEKSHNVEKKITTLRKKNEKSTLRLNKQISSFISVIIALLFVGLIYLNSRDSSQPDLNPVPFVQDTLQSNIHMSEMSELTKANGQLLSLIEILGKQDIKNITSLKLQDGVLVIETDSSLDISEKDTVDQEYIEKNIIGLNVESLFIPKQINWVSVDSAVKDIHSHFPTARFYIPQAKSSKFRPLMIRTVSNFPPQKLIDYIATFADNIRFNKLIIERQEDQLQFSTVFYLSVLDSTK